MEKPDSAGRFLRIDDADAATPSDRGNDAVPSKPCVVTGCDGMMYFHPRLEVASAPHTLEWPWRASWRCSQDPTHVQLIDATDEHVIRSRRRGVNGARYPGRV
jgi:hypothetical protein